LEARDGQREPHYEVVGMNMWRRFVLGGEGPELTLAEAAAALGVSVATVRKLIRRGRLVAHMRPGSGFRVVPVTRGSEDADETPRPSVSDAQLQSLWEEIKDSRLRLAGVESEREDLKARLLAAEDALLSAQRQLSDLWQLLKQENQRPSRIDDEPALLSAGVDEPGTAERVQDVIFGYRSLFKTRRRWPAIG
jgi:excisionase family DNA binding protein